MLYDDPSQRSLMRPGVNEKNFDNFTILTILQNPAFYSIFFFRFSRFSVSVKIIIKLQYG